MSTIHDLDPLLVDARTAAILLSISQRTLWTLTRRAEIVAVRIGCRVLYDRRDLIAFIDRAKKRPAVATGEPCECDRPDSDEGRAVT